MIDGSEGGKYYLYPNGNLARLDKDKPMLGRIQVDKKMPLPDFLSTTLAWITKNEKKLKQTWGCGNISAYYSQGNARFEDGQLYTMFNTSEHPIITRANDYNMLFTGDNVPNVEPIGVALQSGNSGDTIPIAINGGVRVTPEGATPLPNTTILNSCITRDVSTGDVIQPSDIEVGGE